MANLAQLDRLAGDVICDMLQIGGSTLVGTGVYGLWTGGVGLGALGAGALSLLAHQYACQPMDMGGPDNPDQVDGCAEMEEGGYGQLQANNGNGVWNSVTAGGDGDKATKINGVEVTDYIDGRGYAVIIRFSYVNGPDNYGYTYEYFPTKEEAEAVTWRILPTNGSCKRENDEPFPYPPDLDDPIVKTDPVTNCTYNFIFLGFAQQSPGGSVQPVFQVESVATGGRADGGVMGGCNLPPVIYYPGDGGDGGGTVVPVPPDPDPDGDIPWWVLPLLTALTTTLLNQIMNMLNNVLGTPMAPGAFTLTAPCDKDDGGNPLTATWDWQQQPLFERLHDHQVVMMEIMQQHLNWKTPTCGHEKPALEGQWVTTRWESLEKMDHSGKRLRKLFRYRTKSTRDLGQLSTYWKDVEWKSGDFCVRHTGAWWGDPQIWAESEEEGKRIIRLAGAEAGIDPDQAGRWAVSRSRSPRYGMSATMKVAVYKGFPWIASRDGEAWPNTLALERDP